MAQKKKKKKGQCIEVPNRMFDSSADIKNVKIVVFGFKTHICKKKKKKRNKIASFGESIAKMFSKVFLFSSYFKSLTLP